MTFPVSKGATMPETLLKPALFYSSAREGMRDLLDNLGTDQTDGVLLPAYIGWSPQEGSGVCDPVRDSGRPFDFYPLKDDLRVDLRGLEALAATGRFRILVVIHYFGRVQPHMPKIARIARQHGLVLVEDLAHGLYTAMVGQRAGLTGDVNLYSLHKMLPTGTGGMVTYRDPSLLSNQRSTAPQFATDLASYDLAAIARRRRDNFEKLADILSGSASYGDAFRLLWPCLAEGEVPQTLPVVMQRECRDAIYAEMNANGVGMVSLYHTLIPELVGRFPRMTWLAKHILNFPVHQDVTEADLRPMSECFEAAVGSCG